MRHGFERGHSPGLRTRRHDEHIQRREKRRAVGHETGKRHGLRRTPAHLVQQHSVPCQDKSGVRHGLTQQGRGRHRHVLSFLFRERAHVPDDEVSLAQAELRSIRGAGCGISMPVWMTSILAAGTPLSIRPRRTASETAMMPSHVHLYFIRCSQGFLGRNATWRVTTRRTCGTERFPERDRERPPAVRMDDVGGAQSEFRDRESGRLGSFGQYARRRAHDGLPVSPRAQSPRQREQGFLPAAPGFFGVHVDDGKRSQKNDCSTFRL